MKKRSDFNCILIIRNPASTNASRLKRRTQELEELFPNTPVTILETSPNGRESNRKLLIKHRGQLGPNTLLCIAAGDGTVNLVIETLQSDSALSEEMRQTPLLPMWSGNANDLAHMLNGYSQLTNLHSVFRRGRIIAVSPLKITMCQGNKKSIRFAACYASFGATAFAAHRINLPSHRRQKLNAWPVLRIIPEIYTVGRAFAEVPHFNIKENAHIYKLYEYAFINGSRIAKIERLPIRLTDNAFFMAKITRKHPIVFLYALQLLRKRPFGRITSKGRHFEILEPTWLQLDGEVVELSAGTKVHISLGDRPFYALSKRLRNLNLKNQ